MTVAPSLGKVRTGQLLTTFGPGAIVDLSDGGSYLVRGIDDWHAGDRVDEPNLEHILHVRKLATPASDKSERDIPVVGFPRYHHCSNPTCGRLILGRTCRTCDRAAPPARFISVCRAGHLDDFPWSWWVHEGDVNHVCDDLVLDDRSGSNSLSDLWVECKVAPARRSLRGALEPRSFANFDCVGARPWLGDVDPAKCDLRVTGALRGASNVYFSNTLSALSLPRHGSPIHVALKEHWGTLEKLDDDDLRHLVLGKLLLGTNFTPKEGLRAFHDRSNVAPDAASLRGEEYEALTASHASTPLGPPAPYFEAVEAVPPANMLNVFERVVLVRRLREVTALRGFTRLEAPDPDEPDAVVPAPISRAKPTWLPAREMFGEGIFLLLNPNAVKKLADDEDSTRRAKAISAAYGNWRAEHNLKADLDGVSPKRLLIHTLAHLIARELSLACGYGSSARRVRV